MNFDAPLFEGQLVRLSAIDPDHDAQIESRWTSDNDYLRMMGVDLVRPLSPAQVRKNYLDIEKEIDEKGDLFYFAVRRLPEADTNDPDELLGFVKVERIEWSHGVGALSLAIGDPVQRRKGFGSDVLRLILRYAFLELNLYRVSASVPAYNQAAIRLFGKASFKNEARQRESYHWAGKRWDKYYLGLLRGEWEQESW
jgi:RimJ/RimL family protein N-acetyltransferase